jgi:hypothetical protein
LVCHGLSTSKLEVVAWMGDQLARPSHTAPAAVAMIARIAKIRNFRALTGLAPYLRANRSSVLSLTPKGYVIGGILEV